MCSAPSNEPLTLATIHREARQALAAAGIADAALDARILVEHFTATTRTDALVSPERAVSQVEADAVGAAVARRAGGEPVHRILGWREFYGLRLALSPETLEPRPDTEALVELALPHVKAVAAAKGGCAIVDLGTGTGAIALALLKECPQASALGVDISAEALATAARNADMNGVAMRFSTLNSDWFASLEGRFDLIVSNPPYIARDVWQQLSREVRDFDPERALVGGADGLDAYRTIAAGAAGHLEPGGLVALEVGHDQQEAVTRLFADAGYAAEGSRQDLGGHARALAFRARGASERSL